MTRHSLLFALLVVVGCKSGPKVAQSTSRCPFGERWFNQYDGFDRIIGAGCYSDSEYIALLERWSPDDSAFSKTLKTFTVEVHITRSCEGCDIIPVDSVGSSLPSMTH